MRFIVLPDKPDNKALEVYSVSQPWTKIPTIPDSYLDFGMHWPDSSYQTDFVVSKNNTIYLISHHSIVCLKASSGSSQSPEYQKHVIYEHNIWIRGLALRTISSSNGFTFERLYFSADDPKAPGERTQFFWLDEQKGIANLYWSVSKFDLKVPDPCNPTQEIGFFYPGEFTFIGADTIFLSNGNSIPCGLFQVDGAGSDAVSGKPKRIFVTDAFSMSNLRSDPNENGLVFTRYADSPEKYQVQRFDLKTKKIQIIWNTQGIPFRGFTTASLDKNFFLKFPWRIVRRISKIISAASR